MSEKKGIFSFLNVDSIMNNLLGLVEKRVELFKVEMKEESAKAAARLVVVVIVALSLFMAALFISIGMSFAIGRMLDDEMLGFFIVGGFYLLILIILIFANKALGITAKLEKKILEVLNNSGDDNEA